MVLGTVGTMFVRVQRALSDTDKPVIGSFFRQGAGEDPHFTSELGMMGRVKVRFKEGTRALCMRIACVCSVCGARACVTSSALLHFRQLALSQLDVYHLYMYTRIHTSIARVLITTA